MPANIFKDGDKLFYKKNGEKIPVIFKNQGQKNARVVFPDGKEDLAPILDLEYRNEQVGFEELQEEKGDIIVPISLEMEALKDKDKEKKDKEKLIEWDVSLVYLPTLRFKAVNKEAAIKAYNDSMGITSTIHEYSAVPVHPNK